MNPYLVFGLGYRSFQIDVDSADPDSSGFVDMSGRRPAAVHAREPVILPIERSARPTADGSAAIVA